MFQIIELIINCIIALQPVILTGLSKLIPFLLSYLKEQFKNNDIINICLQNFELFLICVFTLYNN